MEINLTDLVNGNVVNQEWSGTGVFDELMEAVNKNIEVQYQKGRITGSDYAQVYMNSIQAVMQQAVQFLLQKDMVAAQIANLAKELEIKDKELLIRDKDLALKEKELEIKVLEIEEVIPKEIAIKEQELIIKVQQAEIAREELEIKITEAQRLRDTTEAELEKQWGYQVSRDANGELVLGASTGNGKVDKEIMLADKQATLLDTQEKGEQFKVDYLMPKELEQITAQVMAVEKDVEVKEQQKVNLITEDKVAAQRIVGRAQSTIIKE